MQFHEPYSDEEFSDRHDPQETDLSDDDETQVAACPACGEDLYEDADRCPYCGEWVVRTLDGGRRHWVWIVAAVLAAAAMIVLSVF